MSDKPRKVSRKDYLRSGKYAAALMTFGLLNKRR